MNDGENSLMMSDSLRGIVPELEDDELKKFEDSLIIVSLQLSDKKTTDILSGVLVGCSIEEKIIKVDFRLDTSKAYSWFFNFASNNWKCDRLILLHVDEVKDISGPFRLRCPKISDVDRQTMMSTIGVDLIRD